VVGRRAPHPDSTGTCDVSSTRHRTTVSLSACLRTDQYSLYSAISRCDRGSRRIRFVATDSCSARGQSGHAGPVLVVGKRHSRIGIRYGAVVPLFEMRHVRLPESSGARFGARSRPAADP
jgi:hypothetical protein